MEIKIENITYLLDSGGNILMYNDLGFCGSLHTSERLRELQQLIALALTTKALQRGE